MEGIPLTPIEPRMQTPQPAALEEFLDIPPDETPELRGALLENETLPAARLAELRVYQCRLEGCRLPGAVLRRAEFVDTVFDRCDLSGADLDGAYFSRCVFTGCKGVGARMQQAVLKNVRIERCNFSMCDFTGAAFASVLVDDCDLSGAWLTECRHRQLELRQVKLCSASLFHTPLKGLDLTGCRIDDITVAAEDLPGVIVDTWQAAGLARLLGVVVKG